MMPDIFLICLNATVPIRGIFIAAGGSKVLVEIAVVDVVLVLRRSREKATRCIGKGEGDFIYVWQNEAIVGPLSYNQQPHGPSWHYISGRFKVRGV